MLRSLHKSRTAWSRWFTVWCGCQDHSVQMRAVARCWAPWAFSFPTHVTIFIQSHAKFQERTQFETLSWTSLGHSVGGDRHGLRHPLVDTLCLRLNLDHLHFSVLNLEAFWFPLDSSNTYSVCLVLPLACLEKAYATTFPAPCPWSTLTSESRHNIGKASDKEASVFKMLIFPSRLFKFFSIFLEDIQFT